MPGKKGMKQARPKTQQERDQYALTKIEELLDAVVLNGRSIAKWNPVRMRALEIRYNKLRASLASTELTDKREGYADVLKRLSVEKQQAVAPQPDPAPEADAGRHVAGAQVH